MSFFTSWIKRITAPREQQPAQYVSWYREVWDYKPVFYLCKFENDTGYWYSPDMAKAHRFTSFEEALKVTPTYDGSARIAERAGVMAIT